MDHKEAWRLASLAMSNALAEAGIDRARIEELVQHSRMINPQIDQAFTIVGRSLVEAEQAKKH